MAPARTRQRGAAADLRQHAAWKSAPSRRLLLSLKMMALMQHARHMTASCVQQRKERSVPSPMLPQWVKRRLGPAGSPPKGQRRRTPLLLPQEIQWMAPRQAVQLTIAGVHMRMQSSAPALLLLLVTNTSPAQTTQQLARDHMIFPHSLPPLDAQETALPRAMRQQAVAEPQQHKSWGALPPLPPKAEGTALESIQQHRMQRNALQLALERRAQASPLQQTVREHRGLLHHVLALGTKDTAHPRAMHQLAAAGLPQQREQRSSWQRLLLEAILLPLIKQQEAMADRQKQGALWSALLLALKARNAARACAMQLAADRRSAPTMPVALHPTGSTMQGAAAGLHMQGELWSLVPAQARGMAQLRAKQGAAADLQQHREALSAVLPRAREMAVLRRRPTAGLWHHKERWRPVPHLSLEARAMAPPHAMQQQSAAGL